MAGYQQLDLEELNRRLAAHGIAPFEEGFGTLGGGGHAQIGRLMIGGEGQALVEQSELFARTVTSKLMAYALGRRLEYYDQPAVRKIVRDATPHEYRWSAIILGIVRSPAFLECEGHRAPQ